MADLLGDHMHHPHHHNQHHHHHPQLHHHHSHHPQQSQQHQQQQMMIDIVEPLDVDVLCGRGGAALRHPGNQNYRRLVNMNKALYITCLKTEKLKISRSIVAAIREQKGRFLEKDADKGTWYDIGDKKAVEKTSQALREGQPKLRQKIVEMGGVDASTAAMMETQFGRNPNEAGAGGVVGAGGGGGMYSDGLTAEASSLEPNPMMPPPSAPPQRFHQSQHDAAVAAATAAAMRHQHDMHVMQPPVPRQDLHSEMLNRLSLHDMSGIDVDPRISPRKIRPGLTPRTQDMGVAESQISLLSEYSAFGGQNATPSIPNESIMSIDSSFRRNLPSLGSMIGSGSQFSVDGDGSSMQPPMAQTSNGNISRDSNTPIARDKMAGMDRRRVFAKMKYSRPPSVRNPKNNSSIPSQIQQASQHSLSDGMPEIHMVESQLSIYSNLSTMTGVESQKHMNSDSQRQMSSESKQSFVETCKVIDHSRINAFPDVLGSGSRHSIMSGLSRISDSSMDGHSIFSDLSRKIGNVSTRSIAMSEISAIELNEKDDEEDDNNSTDQQFDGSGTTSTLENSRKIQTAVEFDF